MFICIGMVTFINIANTTNRPHDSIKFFLKELPSKLQEKSLPNDHSSVWNVVLIYILQSEKPDIFQLEKPEKDYTNIMRQLDPKQRKALSLFQKFNTVTASQIGELFGFKPRTSSLLCKTWVEKGFLEIVDPSKKGRTYKLTMQYEMLLSK